MDRARQVGLVALVFVITMVPIGLGSGPSLALAADVAWPVSMLVVSEVQTGSASASDEFVEIANQGAASVDLAGLEVVYATSSGSTVTRKATWTASTLLSPGRRVLIANAAGLFAPGADLTYASGFAATGGAIALRVMGGAVVDSVGWGDASSGFVEGPAAPAPPAGSSLERLPGGVAGNGIDTNANLADWMVQGVPSPQSMSAAPVPVGPGPTPTPTPSPVATPTPTPVATPTPTPVVTPTPAPTPTPTPTPLVTPSPSPKPTPAPVVTPIGQAHTLADDVTVTIEGVLTTDLGALESGRSGFVQDATGGIGMYLVAVVVGSHPAGATVHVTGTLGTRYHQRVLRIAEADIAFGPTGTIPAAVSLATGQVGEDAEGSRIVVQGVVIGSADSLADGLGIDVDDGSGVTRAVIGPDALGADTIASGDLVTVTGPLGQRDSGGTGLGGYRLYATLAGEFEIEAPTPTPSPTPTPTPVPTAQPTPTPTPSPIATATPGPTATPTPAPTSSPTPSPSPSAGDAVSISAARQRPMGATVTVRAVVTAEAGRIGTERLFSIGDAIAGIAVRLPIGESGPSRGAMVIVTGILAAPYGQLEIRPTAGNVRLDGTGALPAPFAVLAAGLGESTEGRLITILGRLTAKPSRSSSGDLTFRFERADGTRFTVQADVSSGLVATSLQAKATYLVVGIAGQRATHSGALDGYKAWARDRNDFKLQSAAAAPAPSGSPSPTSSPGSTKTISIAQAVRQASGKVVIEATVTATSTLLDASGRRIVVQDATGAVEVLLPVDSARLSVGARVRLGGTMGTAYGAPRLRSTDVDRRSASAAVTPLRLYAAPTAAHVWRLVIVTGRIADVHKLGDRWRAELVVGSARLPIVGQAGAGIPVDRVIEGRTATVVGIVRAAYPSASDKRASILPRSAADLRVGAATTAQAGSGATGTATGAAGGSGVGASGVGASATGGAVPASPDSSIPDADLAELANYDGLTVRVGGVVMDLTAGGFTLDDSTAVATIAVTGEALEQLTLVEPDDIVNVIGTVRQTDTGWIVTASAPDAIGRAGDPIATIDGEATDPATTESSAPPSSVDHAGFDLPGTGPAGLAGLGTLIALSVISLIATFAVRRQRARLALAGRIARRLAMVTQPATQPATLAAGSAPLAGSSVPDHDPRSRDPA